LAGFEQRNILVAALRIARLDHNRRIGRVHHFRERIAIERKAAAGRRRPELDLGPLNGLTPLLGRDCGNRAEQHDAGADR
jgi:hypothetical protein